MKGQNEEYYEESEDYPEFEECSRCDGHPACEDFGCAFKLGCGHLVQVNENNINDI